MCVSVYISVSVCVQIDVRVSVCVWLYICVCVRVCARIHSQHTQRVYNILQVHVESMDLTDESPYQMHEASMVTQYLPYQMHQFPRLRNTYLPLHSTSLMPTRRSHG